MFLVEVISLSGSINESKYLINANYRGNLDYIWYPRQRNRQCSLTKSYRALFVKRLNENKVLKFQHEQNYSESFFAKTKFSWYPVLFRAQAQKHLWGFALRIKSSFQVSCFSLTDSFTPRYMCCLGTTKEPDLMARDLELQNCCRRRKTMKQFWTFCQIRARLIGMSVQWTVGTKHNSRYGTSPERAANDWG